MKVLEVTTLLKGGSGLVTTNIAVGLKKLGHEVDVVSTGQIDSLYDWPELHNELKESHVGYHQMNFFKEIMSYFGLRPRNWLIC